MFWECRNNKEQMPYHKQSFRYIKQHACGISMNSKNYHLFPFKQPQPHSISQQATQIFFVSGHPLQTSWNKKKMLIIFEGGSESRDSPCSIMSLSDPLTPSQHESKRVLLSWIIIYHRSYTKLEEWWGRYLVLSER